MIVPTGPSALDFLAEVAEYDRLAEVGRWPGPRHRMTFRVFGQGPPMLLVPGLASTTHEDLVDDLFGLIDHFGLGRAHLFGLSFGATPVLRALHRLPDRFSEELAELVGDFGLAG